jgi:ribonuclease HIII
LDFRKQIVYDSELPENLNNVAQKVYFHHENVSENPAIIDLFTTEKSFFKYSNELSLKWSDDLILETKADGIYFSVALASIIARAIFLIEMGRLEDKYKMKLPLGAGNVIETGRKFIDQYGRDELAKFCKTTFKTFNEL